MRGWHFNFSTMTIKQKLVNYCTQNGIEVRFAPVKDGFMLGLCKIDKGNFIIDPTVNWSSETDVSLILHELGHLLSVPREHRAKLTAHLRGVEQKYVCEYAARLVSYNLCMKLDIPLKYCLGIFGSDPDTPDRNHTIEMFYYHALKWYEDDRWQYKKEAIMDC